MSSKKVSLALLMALCMLSLSAAVLVHADGAAGAVAGAPPPVLSGSEYMKCWDPLSISNMIFTFIFSRKTVLYPANHSFEKLNPSCFYSMFIDTGFDLELSKKLKAYFDGVVSQPSAH
ncbi:hypothetical protein AMTR_s00001p00185890 [Amborella trichopoda]|uniref:Uncharacterized protein n=1 Tax=Amborella trichopoda TaxID=13333 RepID=W1NM18_AMBTC|nr:hypothetical protein AMTR_s00001p00185890 [Amborella trichopoda]